MKIIGILKFKTNEFHPDVKDYIDECSDIYYFEDSIYSWNTDKENLKHYIKHDLSLVAGGGYSTKGIDILSFTIKIL